MKATIQLANDQDYFRLFHSFFACHNTFSHDSDCIEFSRDRDDMTLKIDMTVGGITYGKKGLDWNERLGNENIGRSFMEKALLYFFYADTNPEYDQYLLDLGWIWGNPNGNAPKSLKKID